MTAMLYSGQKSVTGKKLMKLTEKFYSPEAPGPLSRWAAGPLGRYRPFASKEMSGPAECAERLDKLRPPLKQA